MKDVVFSKSRTWGYPRWPNTREATRRAEETQFSRALARSRSLSCIGMTPVVDSRLFFSLHDAKDKLITTFSYFMKFVVFFSS